MRTEGGFGGPALLGTGTALNSETGETYRLTISGIALGSGAFFNLFTPEEITPGVSLDRLTGSSMARSKRRGSHMVGICVATPE